MIDKIQIDSQCCGISSSLDYRKSRWRLAKLGELSSRLNWSSESMGLVRRVPIVPASCCRRPEGKGGARKPMMPDDSQLDRPARVPAWSPSMVVEHLNQGMRAQQAEEEEPGGEEEELSLGDLMERRWSGQGSLLSAERNGTNFSNQQRRLLAKQDNFNRRPLGQREDSEPKRVGRRWAVESKVDEEERVLSRLVERVSDEEIDFQEEAEPPAGSSLDFKSKLSGLRELLFRCDGNGTGRKRTGGSGELAGKEECGALTFKWPNKLQINYQQYKIIEKYLLAEMARVGHRQPGASSGGQLVSGGKQRRQANGEGGEQEVRERRLAELADIVGRDPELSCAPRSYYDRATIYTRGCQPAIRGWLDSSAHILFVTGFCILTVLKFCSVVLLRLEIREMIHKIRVLKGMATEYNALHDLEAYLPRPSVCAQAAELTPSGVAAALTCTSSAASPTPGHRHGGSFSEAVVAATAAAAHTSASNQSVGAQLGLGSAGRAVSMKTMGALSPRLAPTLCPRSSSSSSAHLHAGSLTGSSHNNAFSLHSDPFQANAIMFRRHTAVSVCPAAAAAAAAAAHHLMSRRGTYVANPAFGANPLMGSALKLSQHRHSAHTVNNAGLLQLQPKLRHQLSAGNRSAASGRYPADSHSQRIEHQNSTDSNNQATGLHSNPPSSPDCSQHLLPLLHPFKRQSSGGAQSAADFSLDPPPSNTICESRRSIH